LIPDNQITALKIFVLQPILPQLVLSARSASQFTPLSSYTHACNEHVGTPSWLVTADLLLNVLISDYLQCYVVTIQSAQFCEENELRYIIPHCLHLYLLCMYIVLGS